MPDLEDLVLCARRHHSDRLALLYRAVHHADVNHDAAVRIVLAVENKGAERGVLIAAGGRDSLYDIVEHGLDIYARLRAYLGGVHRLDADDVLYLLLHPLRIGGGKVDLIQHGQDLEIVLGGKIGICEGLSLNALSRVHDEDGALAGGERSADLVAEVHVTRGVDKIKNVVLPVRRLIVEADGAGLYRYPVLALKVHIVKELIGHLPLGDGAA